MSGNGGKLCRQRQERRPSFSLHSCPGISFSPSRISSTSSHGNSISTKERKTYFHSSSKEPVCKKQCWKDNQTKKTCKDIRSCKSIDSIYYLNGKYFGKRHQGKIKVDKLRDFSLEKKSKSCPSIKEKCANECECVTNLSVEAFTDNHEHINSVKSISEERYESTTVQLFDNPTSDSSVIVETCNIEDGHVTQTSTKEKDNFVNSKQNLPQSKVFFPNSLLLFPFPATPVEKCLSPRTPCLSPLTPWVAYDKIEPPSTDSKKTRGSRFDFGASFLRRFSLTQLTS